MTTVTKTLHPLPFQHLEPKRFEDLVRQLAYDFRNWRALEATGAGGADDSFDIRGLEAVEAQPKNEDDEDEETPDAKAKDRLWLIQCKREQEIGPTKLVGYVDAIPDEEAKKLHGVIIAASCTFTKKARDAFINRCRERGFAECYLWSRAELEDMLYQPKNDGILFAYFGISLTIRRRTVAANIRTRLSAKRKVIRAFESTDAMYQPVLVVDVNSNYPYRDQETTPLNMVGWRRMIAVEHYPRGIILEMYRYHAYLSKDGKNWDVAPTVDIANTQHDRFWSTQKEDDDYEKHHAEVDAFVQTLDREERAQCTVSIYLEYDRIIEIDKDGDRSSRGPIIYIEFEKPGRLGVGSRALIKSSSFVEQNVNGKTVMRSPGRTLNVDERDIDRVQIFPEHMRLKVW